MAGDQAHCDRGTHLYGGRHKNREGQNEQWKKCEADREDTKTQPHRPISLAAVGIAYWLSNES